MFKPSGFPGVHEFVCVSCEFDDDTCVKSFLDRFRTAANLEFHLHYGLSNDVLSHICTTFTHVQNLTLSDLNFPLCPNRSHEILQGFSKLKKEHLKSLSLAFIGKQEDQDETFDSINEIGRLRHIFQTVYKACDINIEMDAI